MAYWFLHFFLPLIEIFKTKHLNHAVVSGAGPRAMGTERGQWINRSRVPRRSSGRIKGGATTVKEERGPGLDFILCFVCGSMFAGSRLLLPDLRTVLHMFSQKYCFNWSSNVVSLSSISLCNFLSSNIPLR